MESRQEIWIIPFSEINKSILYFLKVNLELIFDVKTYIKEQVDIPVNGYDSKRKQINGDYFLSKLHRFVKPSSRKIIGITDKDLYAGNLNFIFGEASLAEKTAVISIKRLSQSFYHLPEDKEKFLLRCLKEAVHELGHCFGLSHCLNSECVMAFSNSIIDTDRKKPHFCTNCRNILEEIK